MNKEETFSVDLHSMRQYFNAGHTISYEFRKKQLLLLKEMIERHEEDIFAALYADLNTIDISRYSSGIYLLVVKDSVGKTSNLKIQKI